jgi:heterodisulfide reductase subunit A
MIHEKLGVFICECEGKIRSYLKLDRLTKDIQSLPNVATCQKLRNACSPDGLATIQRSIKEDGLTRVLVAGCTARTLAPRFKQSCQSCGIPGDHFELVDIREGCAWVHSGEPHEATIKAYDLIRMGVTRLTLRETFPLLNSEVVPAALVLGGGIAGITAALNIANAGIPVKLIEKEAELGGMLRHVWSLHPNEQTIDQPLAEKIKAVTQHPQIDVRLDTKVTSVSGTVGHYSVNLNKNGTNTKNLDSCDVGAIVVATGAQIFDTRGSFNHDGRRVTTQHEFENELSELENNNGAAPLPDKIVMILCSQQHDGQHAYCYGACCTCALKQVEAIKRVNPTAEITFLFHDLYLPTCEDSIGEWQKAHENGVVFMRFPTSAPPEVKDGVVRVYDNLTAKSYRLSYDRVILPSPLVPQPDAGFVAHMLKIDQDENGFFPQMRDRLRPEDRCDRGIYICGAAHYPCDWQEAEFQAINAAFRTIRHIRAREITRHWSTAFVDSERCTGCGTCVEACPYHAISMKKRDGLFDISQIDAWLCKGCGSCAVTCPVRAISLSDESDAQLLGQIEAALADNPEDNRGRVLIFGCAWSGHAAAELAGARHLSYPLDTRLIPLGCSARFDPLHALWGFFNGADGVFIAACPPGDCHYINGNQSLQKRVENLHQLLAGYGFDPRRLRLAWTPPDDPHLFVEKITDFTDLLQALSRNPIQFAQDS